jgi:nitrous oxidase accessory protein NosD
MWLGIWLPYMELYTMYLRSIYDNHHSSTLRIVSPLSSSSDHFYPTIAAALAMSQSGDTILIKPGLYVESLVIDKAVSLIGDGDRAHIVIESYNRPCLTLRTSGIHIEGLTVRVRASSSRKSYLYGAIDLSRGQAEIVDCDLFSSSYACLYLSGHETVGIVRDCTIHDSSGYGVLIATVSRGVFDQCVISGNTFAEVAVIQNSEVTLRDCTLAHGKGYGLLVTECSLGRVQHCDIYQNAQAGVAICEGSEAEISACTLHDGRASGVTFRQDAHGVMEYCKIYANASSAIEIKQHSDPTIRGCKIYKGKWSGIFVSEGSQGIIEDCDIFDNILAGIEVSRESDPTICRCRIQHHMYQGIAVFQGGRGTVNDCDLRENDQGSVLIEAGSQLSLERNYE